MAADYDFTERLADLRARLAEYEVALADLDMETGAGFFRFDIARDELIGVLLGEPSEGDHGIIGDLLARHDWGNRGR